MGPKWGGVLCFVADEDVQRPGNYMAEAGVNTKLTHWPWPCGSAMGVTTLAWWLQLPVITCNYHWGHELRRTWSESCSPWMGKTCLLVSCILWLAKLFHKWFLKLKETPMPRFSRGRWFITLNSKFLIARQIFPLTFLWWKPAAIYTLLNPRHHPC